MTKKFTTMNVSSAMWIFSVIFAKFRSCWFGHVISLKAMTIKMLKNQPAFLLASTLSSFSFRPFPFFLSSFFPWPERRLLAPFLSLEWSIFGRSHTESLCRSRCRTPRHTRCKPGGDEIRQVYKTVSRPVEQVPQFKGWESGCKLPLVPRPSKQNWQVQSLFGANAEKPDRHVLATQDFWSID